MSETKRKPVLKIIATDGNAYALLARARIVAHKNGLDWDEIRKEAIAGDYDHLLQTLIKYFDVVCHKLQLFTRRC